MFTGIIQHKGNVVALNAKGASAVLQVRVPEVVAKRLKVGGSIAVNGVCLSVLKKRGMSLTFEVMSETLRVTNFGGLKPDEVVNLEEPLRMGDPLGGHFVQGHVEGVGKIVAMDEEVWTVQLPKHLMKYIAPKGSIALDGISLTVAKKKGTTIQVSLLHDTFKRTNLQNKVVGDTLNVETDVIVKLFRDT